MRLTCPNCGAQYEVPNDVIPQTGRDVQCSNCTKTWFQAHGDLPAPQDGVSAAQEAVQPASGSSGETASAAAPAPEAAPSGAAAATPEQTPGAADPTLRPGRREIDPAVASVLREEAQREKRARAAAQDGLETQPDLGLEDAHDEDPHRREARARVASLRGEDSSLPKPRNPVPQDIDPASRRSLFPDIEEINSSLASGGDRTVAGPAPSPLPGSRIGFRRGFLMAVLIAIVALLIYVLAPQLADMAPALSDVLGDYVSWIDGLRHWLDGQIAALMLWLDGMASTAPVPVGDSAPD